MIAFFSFLVAFIMLWLSWLEAIFRDWPQWKAWPVLLLWSGLLVGLGAYIDREIMEGNGKV